MDKNILQPHLKPIMINLAPSGVIFAVIVFGSVLRLSWFELSWSNDVLFVMFVIAVLLPLTKLPLMFLTDQDPLFGQLGMWSTTDPQERAAQIELLQQRLQDMRSVR